MTAKSMRQHSRPMKTLIVGAVLCVWFGTVTVQAAGCAGDANCKVCKTCEKCAFCWPKTGKGGKCGDLLKQEQKLKDQRRSAPGR